MKGVCIMNIENMEGEMTAGFYFGLALICVAFIICFWFRNENRKK